MRLLLAVDLMLAELNTLMERRVYKSNLHELLQWIYVSSN
jgi:hypothetical protein